MSFGFLYLSSKWQRNIVQQCAAQKVELETRILLLSWQQEGVHSLKRNVVRYGEEHTNLTKPYNTLWYGMGSCISNHTTQCQTFVNYILKYILLWASHILLGPQSECEIWIQSSHCPSPSKSDTADQQTDQDTKHFRSKFSRNWFCREVQLHQTHWTHSPGQAWWQQWQKWKHWKVLILRVVFWKEHQAHRWWLNCEPPLFHKTSVVNEPPRKSIILS